MKASPLNASYTSHNTATEFLQATATWLRDSLLAWVRASPIIAIRADKDESTDIRTRNELAVCIRFIENGTAVEAFIGLEQLKSTKVDDVKDAILDMLKECCIPLEKNILDGI